MIINLHVPQLWPLYLILMVAMDGSLFWFSTDSDWFEIKGRKYNLSVNARLILIIFAVCLSILTYAFVAYLWMHVFKIKIITVV